MQCYRKKSLKEDGHLGRGSLVPKKKKVPNPSPGLKVYAQSIFLDLATPISL